MDPRALLERALTWVREHPEEIVWAARNAAGLRLTVPLDTLRWAALQWEGSKAPRDVEIVAVPPGLRLGATLHVMKTTLRVGATLFVDAVRLGSSEMRIELRLRDVTLAVIGESDSPLATLIRSGALDLSKPGKLVKNLGKRPEIIVDADGDRIVLDLLRDPRIAARVRRSASFLLPFVTVTSIESRGDHLGIQLACFPDGVASAFGSLRPAS